MTALTPGASQEPGKRGRAGKALSRKEQGLLASLGETGGVRKRKEAAGGNKN